MSKDVVIRARVERPIKAALATLAGAPRRESQALRSLVIEGLRRRGLLGNEKPKGDQ